MSFFKPVKNRGVIGNLSDAYIESLGEYVYVNPEKDEQSESNKK